MLFRIDLIFIMNILNIESSPQQMVATFVRVTGLGWFTPNMMNIKNLEKRFSTRKESGSKSLKTQLKNFFKRGNCFE